MSALMYSLIALTAIFYFFSYPGADNDLWGHLFFGKVIWEEGSIPLENRFSYTAAGHSWINHEWLAELLFYAVYALLGSPGLVFLKVAVAGAIVLVLDHSIKRTVSSRGTRTLALVWTMAILAPGFNVRPQIFTYLFFALTIFLLYRCQDGEEKTLYGLAPLMLLWVNLHGGFIAGLGAVGLFCLSHLARHRLKQTRVHLFVAVGLLLASLLVNPYGFKLLTFLSQDLTIGRPITEWQSVRLNSFSTMDFKLAVLFVSSVVVKKRWWGRWETILAILAALFGFWHQRHTPLFAIAAAPVLAQGVDDVRAWLEKNTPTMTLVINRWATWGICGLIGCLLFWAGQVHWQHRFRIVVSPSDFPTQAADFLARNQISGNLAVPFDWGEYFIWKFHPQSRVSIDGRYTTAYPMEVIQASWAWMEGSDGWRMLFERHPSEIAITNRRHPVTGLLRSDPEWVYIYSDPVAFVFVRKVPAQEALLAKFRERRLVAPEPPPLYFPG